jgi:PAS domain S-box-containing protein
MTTDQYAHSQPADILVVDDTIDSLRLLTNILANAGYRVRPAEQSQLGLESALAQTPSLILLDVKMPGMDGFEVCRRLKQDERTREVPVIFIRAAQDVSDRIEGFEAGGVDFVSKPFQELEVLARVKTHLRLFHMQSNLEHMVAERTLELKKEMASHKESELRFRATFEQAAVGIAHVSPEGSFLRINQRFCDIVGYSQKEMLEGAFQDITRPDDLELDLDNVNKLLEGELETYSMEKRYLHKNGAIVWANLTASLLRTSGGKPDYFISVIEEITDKKATESQLIASEERFRNLMAQSPLSIQIHSKDGKLYGSNPAYAKLYALSDEVLAELYENYNVLEDMQAIDLGVMPYIKRTFEGEVVAFPEYEYDGIDTLKTLDIKNPVSRKCWVKTQGYPIKDEDGQVTAAVFITEDITTRKSTEKELLGSRIFTDNLIQSANVMIVGIDAEGKVNIFNPEAERISGYTFDEIKDKDWFSTLVPKEKYPDVYKIFNRLLQGGLTKLFQNPILTRNGEERIISWTNNEVIKNDKPAGVISFGIDVTEQIKAEEERNRMFNLSTDLIGIAGFDGRFKQLNPAWESTLGYSVDELMAKPFIDFIHPDDHHKNDVEVEKLAAGHTTINFENRYVHKDGSIKHISWTATPVVEESVLYCIGRDITEYKKHEEILKESEEKFRMLVDQSPYSIQIFNTDGYIDRVNEAFKKLWGITDESLQDVLDNYNLLKDEEAARLGITKAIQRAFNGESLVLQLIEYDAEKTMSDIGVEVKANKRWIRARLYPVKDSKGEVVNVVEMEEDMTEVKQKQQEILNYQQRLKAMSSELIISEEKQRRAIAADLHDHVGQLLASSRMQIAAIDARMSKEAIFDELNHISAGLLGAIKATRRAIFELSPPQLNEIGLVAALADWMGEEVEVKHGIKAVIMGDDKRFDISNEERYLLFRCVRELMINVIKHAQANKVALRIVEENDLLTIGVEDNGIGMDRTRDLKDPKHSGFGLFSIEERIQNVGGSMDINSKLGSGTKITLFLPIKR